MNRKLNSETSLGSSVSTTLCTVLAAVLLGWSAFAAPDAPIPLDQLGAVAGQQYQGDGLAVSATPEGAQLRCVFQRLTGRVTPEGLSLESTEPGGGQLHLRATAIGREAGERSADIPVGFDVWTDGAGLAVTDVWPFQAGWKPALPPTGTVTVQDGRVQFIRPGLVEEYSVSMDGVRQDFIVEGETLNMEHRTLNPECRVGELRVELALTGARAEALPNGVRLTLAGSGRELAYSRLRVTDATGKELPARFDVAASRQSAAELEREVGGGLPTRRYARLAVLVDDAEAVYPVRIDPTFSDADWVSLNPAFPGANNGVNAIATDENGSVYFGGWFTVIGTVAANCVAKWDGSTWSALGSGVNYVVYALAASGTNLYVGGSFTSAGGVAATNIAKWDGSTWSALGSGVDREVYALALSGTDLYAGGYFTMAGGVPANRIAKWDGDTWSDLSSGMYDPWDQYLVVRALAVIGNDVYAGGYFTAAGGVPASHIAKWDGSSWSALGSGMNWEVSALAASGTELYAGGKFDSAGGVSVNKIARWNGITWSALGTGVRYAYSPSDGRVSALAVLGTNLYAGGLFDTAGGVPVNRIAKWDGETWSALGSGLSSDSYLGSVSALAVSTGALYAGGSFTAAGGLPARYVAQWDGSVWSPFGSGISGGAVRVVAPSGTNLYVGGDFTAAGGVWANRIAKWDGSTWSPLGSGMNDRVYALAATGTNLYAGGWFTTAGEVTANRIARWNGTAWAPLGSGMDGRVYALAISGTDFYAGGSFTTAGGVAAKSIARWNGTSWSALGSGVGFYQYPGTVYELAVNGTDLYVGGEITTAGDLPVSCIAKWDGSTWSALGAGVGGNVYALAVSGNDLYAGGAFTIAGGLPASHIAKWNGSTWSALGAGMTHDVYELARSGTNLYAGGQFTVAGAVFANYIAKWDGTAWSALGSGLSGQVNALAADEAGHLFVGGAFMLAGGKASPYLAQANLTPQPMVIEGIRVDAGVVTLDCRVAACAACAVQRATDVQFTQDLTTLHTTNAPPDGRFTCTDASPPATTAFYRLVQP